MLSPSTLGRISTFVEQSFPPSFLLRKTGRVVPDLPFAGSRPTSLSSRFAWSSSQQNFSASASSGKPLLYELYPHANIFPYAALVFFFFSSTLFFAAVNLREPRQLPSHSPPQTTHSF